ncbi:hypothetical protein HBN50_12835 [Halobacteriovorax sp. GB3]|uniref:hypothetical protein n=1 Tax=Halobacteriovorax sp. GB3 TaxID=2719615 RepID=UPI0023628DD7|nr:hypothetical protein [Halobacteriovorax sp. GB3]MDD0853990.1 hypothetical protein [Halobacteriovorax sp. GB3]
MKVFISIVFFLILTPSFAGNEVGNGGDVIVCNESVTLLDYYEAKDFDFSIPPLEKSKDYREVLTDIFDEFLKIDKKLANQYQKRLQEIENQIDFRASITLTDIPDSNHEALPKGCKLEQIAIRRNQEKNGKLFLVSKDLWDKLDSNNKAGLILHEIIYEHFLYLGEKDSKKARYMNALISHIGSKKPLPSKYKTLLQSKQIPIYR